MILAKRYRIVGQLNSSGMSNTYLAEDIESKDNSKCVIVKQLKPIAGASNPESKAQKLFDREAQALNKLGHHQQIPKLLAHFVEGQHFYLVQEHIQGYTLESEMPLGERWTEPQVLELLRQALTILEFVHNQGVIHLDIKPANIMKRNLDGKLVLIDFGAVKQVQWQSAGHQNLGKTQSTVLSVIGTPGYMPTEQALGKPQVNSDIYALGMTAIRALTGILPQQLIEDEDGEISWQNQAEVSQPLANILSKMVLRVHKKRYQSAAEVLEAIQKLDNKVQSNPIENSSQTTSNSSHFAVPTVISEPESYQYSQAESTKVNSVPTTPPSHQQSQSAPRQKYSMLSGAIAGILLVLTGFTYAGHQYIQKQNQMEQLDTIKSLKNKGKAEECIAQLNAFPEEFEEVRERSTNLRNGCAELLLGKAITFSAENQKLVAIGILEKIPESARDSHNEAQELFLEWSNDIFVAAKNAYEKSCNFNNAVKWAGVIPEDSSVYNEAQEHIRIWQDENNINNNLLQGAKELLAQNTSLVETRTALEKWTLQTVRNQVQTAEQNLQTARNQVQTVDQNLQKAESKISEFKIAGQPASQKQSCHQLPNSSGKTLLGAVSQEAKTIRSNVSQSHSEIARITEILEQLRKNPVNVSGDLIEGLNDVAVRADDGTLFRDYKFYGREGDKYTITLTSRDFDTRVYLIDDSTGEIIGENDDEQGLNDVDSILTVELPKSVYYRVRVSAYHTPNQGGQGDYRINVLLEE